MNSTLDYVSHGNSNKSKRKSKVIYYKSPFVNRGCIVMKKYLENMDPKIKVAFSNFNVLKNQIFSKLKDQSPLTNNSGVVYKLSLIHISEPTRPY